MRTWLVFAIAPALLIVSPVASPAQTTVQVTLRVPVIVTQFSPDVKYVRVVCNLITDAYTDAYKLSNGNQNFKYEDLAVTGGEVVKLVTIVYDVTLTNPAGKSARAACWLQGGSELTSILNPNSSNPAYRTTSTSVNQVETTFVW